MGLLLQLRDVVWVVACVYAVCECVVCLSNEIGIAGMHNKADWLE